MPYGILDQQRLSQASRASLERALDWWQKSMLTTKHKTYFVLAGYDLDQGKEIKLRREIVEGWLAQKIARVRAIVPVETISVFVETRNAVSVKAIFKRKFGKTLQIRKFKANFEFNHQWITTSSSFAWFSRNWFLRIWFEVKRRLGRGMRKRIRYWFKS